MNRQQQLVNSIARAVATRENFFAPPARFPHVAQRLNNPACLKHWKDPQGDPYEELNGYVAFPGCERRGCTHPDHPAETGWRAARAQMKINIVKRGLTFMELVGGRRGTYGGIANASEKHSPEEYAAFLVEQVCRDLGVDARCGSPECYCATAERPRCVLTVMSSLVV